MKKTFLFLALVATLGLSACMVPGKATVNFINHSSISVDFYLDGAVFAGGPFPHTASLTGQEWAGISPGDHTLGAVPNPPVLGQNPLYQSVTLSANQMHWWTITDGLVSN